MRLDPLAYIGLSAFPVAGYTSAEQKGYLLTHGRWFLHLFLIVKICMIQSEHGKIEWYLIFSEAKYDHWIWRFVDKDIGHVYAVKSLNDYQWLVVQPRVNMTDMHILLKSQYPVIRAIADKDDKIIKAKVNVKPKVRGLLNWFTCVEQVKALIGVRSFWTITPKQLYNGLLENKYG